MVKKNKNNKYASFKYCLNEEKYVLLIILLYVYTSKQNVTSHIIKLKALDNGYITNML